MVACAQCGEDDDLSATVLADGRRQITCGKCGHQWVRGDAAPAAAGSGAKAAPPPGSSSARETPTSVNDRSVAAVVEELARHGITTRVVKDGIRREVVARGDVVGREAVLVIKGRTSGDWQTKASLGRALEPERMPYRFWVFVDLLPEGPEFFILPEWQVLVDIHEHHQAYLAENGGQRPRNDKSDHHRIETERVEAGRDQWDQLRIFH